MLVAVGVRALSPSSMRGIRGNVCTLVHRGELLEPFCCASRGQHWLSRPFQQLRRCRGERERAATGIARSQRDRDRSGSEYDPRACPAANRQRFEIRRRRAIERSSGFCGSKRRLGIARGGGEADDEHCHPNGRWRLPYERGCARARGAGRRREADRLDERGRRYGRLRARDRLTRIRGWTADGCLAAAGPAHLRGRRGACWRCQAA